MSDFYTTTVFSFTKNQDYTICVGKEFLKPEDKVLIIDDFLAMGNCSWDKGVSRNGWG